VSRAASAGRYLSPRRHGHRGNTPGKSPRVAARSARALQNSILRSQISTIRLPHIQDRFQLFILRLDDRVTARVSHPENCTSSEQARAGPHDAERQMLLAVPSRSETSTAIASDRNLRFSRHEPPVPNNIDRASHEITNVGTLRAASTVVHRARFPCDRCFIFGFLVFATLPVEGDDLDFARRVTFGAIEARPSFRSPSRPSGPAGARDDRLDAATARARVRPSDRAARPRGATARNDSPWATRSV